MNSQQRSQLPPISNLIKPEQVVRLTGFPEEHLQKYHTGVTGLWHTLSNRPPESKEYRDAHAKLCTVTMQIKTMMSKRAQPQATTQQNNGRPPSSGQQGQQGQQGQSVQQPLPPQQQPQPTANNNPGQQREQFSQRVIQKVKEFSFVVPPNVQAQGQQISAKYISEARIKYAQMLHKYETTSEKSQALERMGRERQAQGRPFTPQEEQQFHEQKKRLEATIHDTKDYLQKFTNSQAQARAQLAQGQVVNGGHSGTEPIKSDPNQKGGIQGMPQQPMKMAEQSQPHTVSSALDAARSQANPGGGPGLSPPIASQAAHAPVNQPQNSHQPAPSQEQFSQPHPNAKSEARSQTQQYNSPSQNGPPQAQPEGHAYPLSHEAAMQQARSYSNPNINAPYPQNTPQSATHSHPPPNNQRESQPISNTHSKMPIPKDLNIPPPQPVSMGQSRPTMTNGPHVSGPIGQPAIPKHPGYVLEGEGERVLSKKKLEDLVRQVTGGPGGEGEEGETLSAEVEEVSLSFLTPFAKNAS